jgi:hypothetical protein
MPGSCPAQLILTYTTTGEVTKLLRERGWNWAKYRRTGKRRFVLVILHASHISYAVLGSQKFPLSCNCLAVKSSSIAQHTKTLQLVLLRHELFLHSLHFGLITLEKKFTNYEAQFRRYLSVCCFCKVAVVSAIKMKCLRYAAVGCVSEEEKVWLLKLI